MAAVAAISAKAAADASRKRLKLVKRKKVHFPEATDSLQENSIQSILQDDDEFAPESMEEAWSPSSATSFQRRLSMDVGSIHDINRLTMRAITGRTHETRRSTFEVNTRSCLLDPRSSRFMGYWDLVGLCALVFTALVTPFEISFLEPSQSALNALFIINRIVDMIFIVDLCLQFVLVFEDESVTDASKRWVTDHGTICRHYLSGWFSIDFISCAVSGFDFMSLSSSPDASAVGLDPSLLQVLRALRLIKLLRLVRLTRLFRRWEKRLSFNYGNMALVKCVVYVLITCHWCACVWSLQTLFVPDLMDTWRGAAGYCWRAGDFDASSTVKASQEGIVCSSPGETWMAGFYLMMMTITSVGYGDISAVNTYEQVWLSVLILATALMWSQVISTFCLVLANAGPADQEFYNAMDGLNDFMSLNALPKGMRTHLRTYFHETRSLRLLRRHRELYASMSPTLAALAFVQINGRAMDSLWIMKDCSSETRFRIMDGMRTRVYAPGERTEHDTMNIVQRGQAMHRGMILSQDDAWGFDIIMQNDDLVRSSEAKALHYLEVHCIRREDLMKLHGVVKEVGDDLSKEERWKLVAEKLG